MAARSDNFNRTPFDSLGTPSGGGSAWIDPSNVWQINADGTKAFCTGGTNEVALLDSGSSNVEAQVTVTDISSTDSGIAVRAADNDNYVLAAFATGSANPKIYTKIAGTYTQIGTSGAETLGHGDVWKVKASGSTIQVFRNGSLVKTETVAYGASNTLHGMRCNGGGAIRFEDFSIADVVSLAPTVTTQPSSSTVTEGATATFTAAFGNTPTSWAWEYAVSPYSSWSAVSGGSGGATTAYTTAATTLAMSGRRYRCTATNVDGSVTTNGAAELTVNAPVADLSAPTVTSVGATTATCGFSTDTATGNGYFLRRTGLSAASAATIISTGESQAISGTGAQTRAMTAFTSGLTYYVDMAQTGSTEVVTAGPFYPGTGRPVSDVDVTGWTASTGSDLWAMLDEDTASDSDYVTSPALSGSATTGSHALDKTYTAGTYSIKVRAKTDTGAGTLAVRLLNGSNVSQGVTADQAITSTWTTYTLAITTTGDATRIRYEVVAA